MLFQKVRLFYTIKFSILIKMVHFLDMFPWNKDVEQTQKCRIWYKWHLINIKAYRTLPELVNHFLFYLSIFVISECYIWSQIARAHREVILSAGAIASPQILMLSGIGPADHLAYHGIPVKVDLPVGKSLQSHVGTGEIVFTVKKQVSYDPMRYFTNPGKYVLPYFTNKGEGPLSSAAGFDAIGNIRTGLDNSTR